MSRSTLGATLLFVSTVFISLPAQAQKYVCVDTNVGEFCMELLRDDAPGTVENFLKYIERGAYDRTFVHRSEPNYVIQAGGYLQEPFAEPVPEDAPIENEFKLSNVRGTVAMAKFAGDPDSATTEWFVNLTDNSETLDISNGGYTVFAKIVKGMAVADGIGNLQRVDLTSSLGDAFARVPVLRKDDDGVGLEDLVLVNRVYGTDDVEVEQNTPDKEQEEKERLFQCTADWITEIDPREACLVTNYGEMCIDLLPESAPNTVANFLHYVADGDYDGTFIHRSEPGFVVQGGGYKFSPLFSSVPRDPTIENEFQVSNTRGTMAMAKLDGDPDSASSEWFVNLADNTNLDTLNGGFTVFGRVREEGMAVIDQIAGLDRWDLSGMFGAFTSVPLRTLGSSGLSLADFVQVQRAYIPGHEVNPCIIPKPAALTEFVNRRFTMPVRMNGVLYEFIFSEVFGDTPFVFRPDLFRIRELKDIGQEAAEYNAADQILRIPSILVGGSTVVYNVRLRLTDTRVLEFRLDSYDLEPPSGQ